MITKLLPRLKHKLISDKEKKIISKFVRSIVERSWDESLMKHVISFVCRTTTTIESYSIAPNQPPWMRAYKSFDAEYTYQLKDVVVSSSTGVAWLPDGRIIGESYGSLNRLMNSKRFQRDYFSTVKKLDVEVIPLPPTDGFFHFIYESLPAALASLENHPECKLMIPVGSPDYVKKIVKLISNEEPLEIDGSVQVTRLIVSGKTPYSGFVQRTELERIKSFFNKKFPTEKSELKIYISRLKDKRRKLENEAELEQQLVKLGFRSYLLQEMSVMQQITLFRKAKIIVAPHGAELSNLIWCNKGVKVIEIFPYKPRNDCYARLSHNLELDYYYILCKKSNYFFGYIPIEEVVQKITTTD